MGLCMLLSGQKKGMPTSKRFPKRRPRNITTKKTDNSDRKNDKMRPRIYPSDMIIKLQQSKYMWSEAQQRCYIIT